MNGIWPIPGPSTIQATFLTLVMVSTSAEEAKSPDENFMLVLRETQGANKRQFNFVPFGPSTGNLANGETITVDSAWFDLIGDMHVRFVVDGETTMRNLTAEEFDAYGLTPTEAVDIAIRNIKARYGQPRAKPWAEGIMVIEGESPDLDSSYFLDRSFWDKVLVKHPEGLIVGVPGRGALVYAPASDREAVAALERSIRSLYESSEDLRVSSALYLYKDRRWTVYRAPSSLN